MAQRARLCRHGLRICSRCVQITDAARRIADQINAAIVFHGNAWDIRHAWMSFRLEDGVTDGRIYDTKREAVRHVSNENYYAFFSFRNAPGGITPFDAQLFLEVHRDAYSNGNRLHDPDDIRGGRNLVPTVQGYENRTPRPVELWRP